MPTYEYQCKSCGEPLEVVQSFTDDALTVCPACGGVLKKVFGNVGIVFKGSGFYKNDSRAKVGAAKGSGSTSPGDGGTSATSPSDGAGAVGGSSNGKTGASGEGGSGSGPSSSPEPSAKPASSPVPAGASSSGAKTNGGAAAPT